MLLFLLPFLMMFLFQNLKNIKLLPEPSSEPKFGSPKSLRVFDFFQKNVIPGASLICTWGDQGAAGYDGSTGSSFQCPAYRPHQVLDTLGAGDTFVATVIAVLFQNPEITIETATRIGCRVAGHKVGQFGFGHLRNIFEEEMKKFQ
jgi:sugar/nucleoside kinase (ribokinase family)